jgi:hypothetical protein
LLTKLTKPCIRVNLVGPQVSLQIWGAPAVMGSTHYFSLNKEALPSMPRYSWWVPAVMGRIHSFWHNKEVLACVRPWTMWVPTVSLSMYIPLSMLLFVDNVDHAVPRTPTRWTTERPRKGMTRRRRSHNSGGMWVSRGMAWPAVGVVGAVRPVWHHSRPWEAGAGSPAGAGFGGWSKKIRD